MPDECAHQAAVVECIGVVRIELDDLVEVPDGTVVLTLVDVGEAAVEEGAREVFLRFLVRLNHRRAAADLNVG